MDETNRTIRIHTGVGSDSPNVLNVQLNQTFDSMEILSLKLTQTNSYNFYESSYGVIVGRVLANDAFGIPNAKVSVFIEVDDAETLSMKGIYPFTSVTSSDNNGVRYNLLPDEQVSECHQNVGTFPNKRLVLDNKSMIEIFDKYWKYTTVTNEVGDYMLFGVPTGDQQLHVDVDLSDIGVLSQRPRDMMYKGYNASLFESPNKFKQSTNLDSLSQIYSQNKGVYVYSYWGDTSDTEETIAITRCDIQLEYEFEPTCVFMGCIVTDQAENAIGKSCAATEKNGRMEKLIAGEGTIEMIRKKVDGKVEEVQIQGNRLIDGDGVWCYQIPMNLDYVRMDEYGNVVPTDNPDKGLPTRTRVRFRFTIDETESDSEARKRCRYLVPNNPRLNEADYPLFTSTKEYDYEFGSGTREESYKDLFWNQVYTVKSYIPRLQKSSKETNKKHTGIKAVNFYADGINPFPYNNVTIKLSFMYRLICVITKFIIYFVATLNLLFSLMSIPVQAAITVLNGVGKIPLIGSILKPILNAIKSVLNVFILRCIGLGTEFCDDGINNITYYIACSSGSWSKTQSNFQEEQATLDDEDKGQAANPGFTSAKDSTLFTCVEQQLAQDNDCINFNFFNDWINGALYFPLWYRKITPKKTRLFGLIRKKAKDEWCSADRQSKGLRMYHPCALNRASIDSEEYTNNEGEKVTPKYVNTSSDCGDECHEEYASETLNYGVILSKENMYGQTLYYYQAGEYHSSLNDNAGGILPLFATDIVLLGSLNDCDLQGIPQFFKYLTPTTYNMPSNILFTDTDVTTDMDSSGNLTTTFDTFTEATGCDWGNLNTSDQCSDPDGGLFYSIGCSTIEMMTKSCINLLRICEFGVSLDETKFIENLSSETEESDYEDNILIPDGYISYDELYNTDARSMFATLNGNYLRTKLNTENGLYEYDFRYLYPNNFDASLYASMEAQQRSCSKTYGNNYNLETFSRDYYKFRMGDNPTFYTLHNKTNGFPVYDNSYYFYFGLNSGSTAIEKFNSEYFASCENVDGEMTSMIVDTSVNDWCSDDEENWDGWVRIDMTGVSTPYTLTITGQTYPSISYALEEMTDEMIYFSNSELSGDEDFADYTWVEEDSNGTTIYLLNGIYTILMTDADGNESSAEINMSNKYVSYSVTVDDFLEDYNTLIEDLESLCAIASKDMEDVKWVTNDGVTELDNRDIGGTITISNLYYNNTSVFEQDIVLRITIEPASNQTISGSDWYIVMEIDTNGPTFTVVTGDDGSKCGVDASKSVQWLTDNDGVYYIVFGMPRGDISYTVTVQQLCWGEIVNEDGTVTEGYVESGNKTKQTVTVDEPLAYKLYINDIDYDIIKNFTTGWTISGTASNPSISISNNATINGWLSISDPDNGYYNWDANELYTIDYYVNMGYSQTEAQDAVDEMKATFIENMKSTFYQMCNAESKSFTFLVQTSYSPYYVRCVYRDETVNSEDEDEDAFYQFTSCTNDVLEESFTLEDMIIPTITTTDNEYYGNTEALISDGVCFAMDKLAATDLGCSGDARFKNPYFVACVNGRGITKPLDGIARTGDDDNGYSLGDSVSNYFGFHVIDKSLRMEYMSWGYVSDMWYFWPTNEDKYGETLTQNGLFTGIINNGVSDSSTYLAAIETQTLGSTTLEIETYQTTSKAAPDEDALPTKRVVVGPHEESNVTITDEDGNITGTYHYCEYTNYVIELPLMVDSGTLNSDATYASLANRTFELNVEDDYCTIYDDSIYGGMKVRLDADNSLNDCTNKANSKLQVTVTSGGTDTKMMYAILTSGGTDYAINLLPSDATSYDEYGLMRYEITEDDLANAACQYVSSQTILEDDEGNTTTESTLGYGTTGLFTFNSATGARAWTKEGIYVIAVTENNCRAMSPVYDFSDVTVQVILMRYNVITLETSEDEITGETIETEVTTSMYYLGVRIENIDDLYYFKYHKFTAEVTNSSVSGATFEMNETTRDQEDEITHQNDGAVYKEITEETFVELYSNLFITGRTSTLAANTSATATDDTGLKHICEITNTILYRVVENRYDEEEVSVTDTNREE